MRRFQCLLFVLNQSYICFYIICMTVPLSTSKKQAVIKLIEKKDKDKRLIKNWRPISFLNVDTKVVSKVLSERLKTALEGSKQHIKTAGLLKWISILL